MADEYDYDWSDYTDWGGWDLDPGLGGGGDSPTAFPPDVFFSGPDEPPDFSGFPGYEPGYGEDENGNIWYTDTEGDTYFYNPDTQDWEISNLGGMPGYEPGYGEENGQITYTTPDGDKYYFDEATGDWTQDYSELTPDKTISTMGDAELAERGFTRNADGTVTDKDGNRIADTDVLRRDGTVVTSTGAPRNKADGSPVRGTSASPSGGAPGGGKSGSSPSSGNSLTDSLKGLMDSLGGIAKPGYTKGQTTNKAEYLGDTGNIQPDSPFAEQLKQYQNTAGKYGGMFDDVVFGTPSTAAGGGGTTAPGAGPAVSYPPTAPPTGGTTTPGTSTPAPGGGGGGPRPAQIIPMYSVANNPDVPAGPNDTTNPDQQTEPTTPVEGGGTEPPVTTTPGTPTTPTTATRGGGLMDLFKSWAENPESAYDTAAGRTLADLASAEMTPQEAAAFKAYSEMAAGPTAEERDLYARTGAYGTTVGEDEARLRENYKNMIENGGFGEEEKRALTGLQMETAATPFAVGRERVGRMAAAGNNPLAAAVAEAGLSRGAGQAMVNAGRQNILDIYGEKERQKELGLKGTENVAGIAANRQQFGLGSQAGQLGQWAQRKAAGAGGLQSGAGQLAARRATGAGGLATLGQNLFGRKTAGGQGLMTLAALAAAQEKANRDAMTGIYGKKREDYTESAQTKVGG